MKKIKRVFLTIVIVLSIVGTMTIGFGLLSQAEEMEIKSEPVTINAENIGIKEIEYKEEVTEEDIYDETEPESEIMDEDVMVDEEIEEDVDCEEETETENPECPECPEGMCEGYEEGVYFEPNHFGDCELHEYCYICPECTIEEELFIDEDINPNNGWVLSKTCIVCGHGGCEPVTDKFVDTYYAK